jgi:uracil-DNA glycosylase
MASQKPISSFFQAPKRLKVSETSLKEVNPNNVTASVTRGNDDAKPQAEAETEVPDATNAPGSQTDVSQEQKIRMELNKSIARAKRNLKICEEHVASAKDRGVAFPEFPQLLLDESWLEVLRGELQKQYMEKLYQFVLEEAAGKFPIYPPPAKVFNAFNTCPFNSVKVVILGQDPYHGPGQAMGLSFSVPEGIKVPSSLGNIYRELKSDVGCSIPNHGNLEKWAFQGVLLLNTVLTVRDHHANSHAKKGWEMFTDAAIRAISQKRTGVVFLLWGKPAQEKTRLIDVSAHHILKSAHPSGLSAHRGFFGCRHFSQTNALLEKAGQLPIDWQL